ncbi:hypothetical protein [Actinoplanes sp. CA-252034]|uniref:hypothetical protein n=1 Tax=Actinoplanes sp. CA-252034 TaxID=3239906 RepID=UPI003D96FFF9
MVTLREDDPEPPTLGIRKRELRAARWAALLAVPGVVIGGLTFCEQQRKEIERDADQVVFWEDGPYVDKADLRRHVTRITVRNTSSQPVTDVVLQAIGDGDAYRPEIVVATVPPCREMVIWVQRDILQETWHRMGRSMALADVPLWRTARMDFTVGGESWERTKTGLAPRPARAHDTWPAEGLAAARIVRNPDAEAIPCGRDG